MTHDPRIALLSDFRIVMQGGRVTRLSQTDDVEKRLSIKVSKLDDALARLREKLRQGLQLSEHKVEEVA